MAAPLTSAWSPDDLQQVRSLSLSGDVGLRAIRALKALVEARMRHRDPEQLQEQVQTLVDALRPTAFGQAHEAALLTRLLPAAEYAGMAADSRVELGGVSDAVYVVLAGSLEVLRGPNAKSRMLTIAVESATSLPGDTEQDRLDPYVVVTTGGRSFTSPVAVDAGPNPVWNWSVTVPYNGEPRVEFMVMEHDDYSRHDLLAVAGIDALLFAGDDGFSGTLVLNHGDTEAKSALGVSGGNSRMSGVHKAVYTGPVGSLKVSLAWAAEPTLGGSLSEPPSRADSPQGRLSVSAPAGSNSPVAGPKESRSRSTSIVGSSPASPERERDKNPAASKVLKAGQFFGMEPGGGTLLTLEHCHLLFVPRSDVTKAVTEYRIDCMREKHSFLRKHFPGAGALEQRLFELFASAFSPVVLPPRRVICRAGRLDNRSVYVLRRGSCNATQPRSGAVTSSPMGRYDEVVRGGDPLEENVGVLGIGSVVGYASALFGVPEPFTATAAEPVKGFTISLAERPVSTWPKEVTGSLYDLLKTRTEFHLGRRMHLSSMPASLPIADTSGLSPQELFQRNVPEWKACESRFWRHKDIPQWRMGTIRDLYDAEGWVPPGGHVGSDAGGLGFAGL
eukprot:CAMPEP_0198565462 /NCGR_PEP_ID=MMETSP1462-20131121/101814_1 /TAXON_ID=1333877 /ORGANISM="Brandtodinium nutriculum, Strain RCC3387" /LENGTH=615 /DNA_ID=CAMNT_0044296455 /DNA_START=1 /DNA_END=1845 /DNA_ORIENTATION=-